MIDIGGLLKEKPFSDRLKIVNGRYPDFFDGEIFTVVCDEKSRATALKIKAQNANAKKIVELSPDFRFDKSESFSGEKNVLIIGEKDLVKKVRLALKSGDNRLIALLCDLSIAECFKKSVIIHDRSGEKKRDLCELNGIVFDLDLSFRSSRANYAEAFCECAAAAAIVAEKRLLDILSDKNGASADILKEAIGFLRGAKAENLFSSIVSAQLCLSKYYSECDENKNDLDSVAGVLKKLDPTSGCGEALFASAKAIISVYKIIIGNDLKNADVIADPDGKLESISELFGADGLSYFSGYEPFPEEVCLNAIGSLSLDPRAVKIVDEAVSDISALEKIYSLTYNGRKRRADYSENAMRFCVSRGAYLSEGILKYYNDFGILEAL